MAIDITNPEGGGVPRDMLEKRRQQHAELLLLLGGAAMELVAGTEGFAITPDQRFNNRYGRLAERLLCTMINRARQLENEHLEQFVMKPNIQSGCYTIAAILRYGPPAYAQAATNRALPAGSAAELGAIMERSHAVLELFARQNNARNRVIETVFGVQGGPPIYEQLPFIMQQDTSGVYRFQASQKSRDLANWEALMETRQNGQEPENKVRICPALGPVLRTLWDVGVAECVRDPALFQGDLAALAI